MSRCFFDGFTSAEQPLDRAVVKPFKEAVRNAAAADLAEMVVSDLDDLSTVMNMPGLKNKIVQWVHTALDDIKSKESLFQHAWSRLFVAGGELPNVLLRARELNHGGQLFKRQECGIVPELLPDAAKPDHQDVKDEPESDWDMHNADAPDDEDAGQETPARSSCTSGDPSTSRCGIGGCSRHRPLQHKKRLVHRKGRRSSSAFVLHMADTHHE